MRRRSVARGAVLAVAFGVVATGCAASHASDDTTSGRVGPQGAVGQFVVECALSHTGFDDPIVHPGHAGASHEHVFFGNRDTGSDSTYEALAGGATSCDQPRDTAAYWAPTLLDGAGRRIEPLRAVAYYRAGPGVDPTTVRAYPPGLKMIGGDQHATGDQPVSVVAWSCGAGRQRSAEPPTCPPGSPLSLSITFPDCWNGTDIDSADHVAHTAASGDGHCPQSHPVPIPQLELVIEYPSTEPDDLVLASGSVLTGHADFWNVWNQAKLETEVAGCLHRDVVCGVG